MTPPTQTTTDSAVKLAATLALAGFLSGAAIVAVYEATLPVIEANAAARLEAAVLEVLPGATRMEGRTWTETGLAPADEGANIYAGFDEGGRLLGYAIPASGGGFQDTIAIIFGYNPERTQVVGYRVLESRETPGLGDRIFKDPAFVGAFSGLEAGADLVLTKPGAAANPGEVDAISGATISSRAVIKIMNAALGEWRERLGGGTP
jgi:electron transport complex protein RnfG